MEIVPASPGGPSLDAVIQDCRRRYAHSEETVLNALLESLSTGQAQALLALREGRPVGAVVFSRRGEAGRIHLLHALPEAPEAWANLLAGAEEALTREGGLAEITASLAILPETTLEETLRRQDYQFMLRAHLVLDLDAFHAQVALPAGYRLVAWQEQYLEQAAILVETVHRSAEDIALYPELASVSGARRLLGRVLGGNFGTFDPALSPMALAGGDALAGLCLAVWHGVLTGQGFILDLGVDPAHRRRGLGRALVVETARAFRAAGAEALGLAVTWTNRPARHLYEGLGFRVEQRFCICQKQPSGV